MPLLARAKKAEKKKPKDWTTVFAELLSVSVDNEQYWMHDNECWMDNKWAQFFYGAPRGENLLRERVLERVA